MRVSARGGLVVLSAVVLFVAGCPGTTTPPADECTSEADCVAGETCENGSCVAAAECTSEADCATGEICDDGTCAPEPECTSEADCATGEICEGGSCIPDGRCTGHDDCATGEVCDAGACVTSTCGDGIVDASAGEECDDANGVDDDGCTGECLFSCVDSEDCGAGEFCDAGNCVSSTCGDGNVDANAGEECDDANHDDADGCTGNCRFTCVQNADCFDGQVCNGTEVCDTSNHVCVPGTAAADGTVCVVEGDPLPHFCRGGVCIANTCGDGFVGGAEQCDDGNAVTDDGCEPDCTYSCSGNADCDDGEPCNGAETCDAHVCAAGLAQFDGTPCGTDKMCIGLVCVTAYCGDGTVHPGEECDDANDVTDDGCEPDCTWTCTSAADCDDGTVCNGLEVCTAAHLCQSGTALDCNDGDPCTADSCDAATGCVNALIDADGDGVYCGTDCDETLASVGAPRTWYKDCDDDGYAGTSNGAQDACYEPAPSSFTCDGWTTRDPASGDDCRDGNPDVHPNATWATAPYTYAVACGGGGLCTETSWDYDCNGTEDQRWTTTGVSETAGCSWDNSRPVLKCYGAEGWTGQSAPACGTTGAFTNCFGTTFASCQRYTSDRLQECR